MPTGAKREVLLVGSVPLGSAEHVFTACADALPGRVARLPDGETGPLPLGGARIANAARRKFPLPGLLTNLAHAIIM